MGVLLPDTVDLTVTGTEPTLQKATASAVMKPATLETGLVINVPPFVNNGDKVKVDTSEGRYIQRVQVTATVRPSHAADSACRAELWPMQLKNSDCREDFCVKIARENCVHGFELPTQIQKCAPDFWRRESSRCSDRRPIRSRKLDSDSHAAMACACTHLVRVFARRTVLDQILQELSGKNQSLR